MERAALKYVMDHFQLIYGASREMVVDYGGSNSKINIQKEESGFLNSTLPCPEQLVWKKWKGQRIPFLFNSSDEKEVLELRDGKAYINYDIIVSAFYFLSGWQEYYNSERDHLGRFPFKESLQQKLGIIEIPVVNYYFDILKTAYEKVNQAELKTSLWNNYPFATFISHDIDKCETGWLEGGFSEIKKGHVYSSVKLVCQKAFGEDQWFNFEKIIGIEKKQNAKSTFFFLAEHKAEKGYPNADYKISNKKFTRIFDLIQQAGSEVGIHGSLGTYKDVQRLKEEISKIKVEVHGNRFHTLAYEIRETPQVIESAGLKYDTSVGFAENIGFRNSFCHPFYPFDFQNKTAFTHLELPLMVMDTTLEYSGYMGVKPENVLQRIEPLIDEVRKFNGLFSLLWHNNYISEYKFEGWGQVFEDIISYCSEHNSYYLTGEEICNKIQNQPFEK